MIRALPGHLDVVLTGRWSSRYVYGCDHAPEVVEAEDYFLPIANFLIDAGGSWRPDRIEVVLTDDDGYLTAEFVVCFASQREVRVKRLTEWIKVGPRGVASTGKGADKAPSLKPTANRGTAGAPKAKTARTGARRKAA